MTHIQTSSPAPRYVRQATRYQATSFATRALQVAGVAAISLGAILAFNRLAQGSDTTPRPRDSAPTRAQRQTWGDDTVLSAAVTVNGTPEAVLAALEEAIGHGLATGMLGTPDITLNRIPHDTPDVISWRSEDGTTLVKLMLRPVRDGRMTALTGLVSIEDAGVMARLKSKLGRGPKSELKHALTEFRMRFETGETARAR
jgi:hypothetical protein